MRPAEQQVAAVGFCIINHLVDGGRRWAGRAVWNADLLTGLATIVVALECDRITVSLDPVRTKAELSGTPVIMRVA